MSERPSDGQSKAQVRGMLWIALLVFLVVMLRAYRHHMLGPAWWRLW